MTALFVVAGVFVLVVATAAVLALGLVVRTARADKAGRQRSDLAGAPDRLTHRDLPELHTSRINIQERP
ncbi:hypothetical protein GCM10027174_44960 [Salinifilum aidingensis]